MDYRTPLLVVCLSLALGCASTFPPNSEPLIQGPGAVFETAEAAALDGLGWTRQAARQDGKTPQLRIGVVRAVEGGYSYDTPDTAPRSTPDQLVYRLRADSVAHFQHYPVSRNAQNASVYEEHSEYQRSVVDALDPQHRPSYLLTPTGRVVVYRGSGMEPEVARIGPAPWWRLADVFAVR